MALARVLLVGGSPQPSRPALVRGLARACDVVVAVDRGLDALLAAGLGCDLFCGDADSVSRPGAELVRAAEERGGVPGDPRGAAGERGGDSVGEVERYDPHKDFTDLALALRAVSERWPHAAVVCTCLSGGRPDHMLAVLGRLAGWDGPVEIEEDGFSARILRVGESWTLAARVGARFSFVPLSGVARVSESGMRWTLDGARVPLLSDLGVSNVIEDGAARISCSEGALAAWCFK